MRDLIHDPVWRPDDLGQPIPDSPHAVSVCLPTWRDHVGYEEQDPRVHEQLQSGYPRFVYNRFCRELFDACRKQFARDSELCQVYPARSAAERFCDFLRRKTGETPRMQAVGLDDVCAVCFPRQHESLAKDYWQHCGEGISSRQAQACLEAGQPPPHNRQESAPGKSPLFDAARQDPAAAPGKPESPSGQAKSILRERISQMTGVTPENVRLFPCGMAGIYAAYRAVNAMFPDRRTVQFGFPYVDTLKIQQKFGAGVHFFPHGDSGDLDELETLLGAQAVAGVFTEFPSNPLLASPDLARLTDLTRRHGIPLIVDETLATFVNADLLPAADVVSTSLTKFFSGVGDVTGGALILNPRGAFYSELSQRIGTQGEALLWDPDATVLEFNSRDFEDRVRKINAHARHLADFLKSHPKISRVYYPQFTSSGEFQAFQRPGGGYGGLLSFTLKNEPRDAPRFFDALRICKGPNLGTNYSLACLYTILAHYRELEFAESCGVSRYLVRVSVGLEDPDDLAQRFREALAIL